jgi:hypothetical protein
MDPARFVFLDETGTATNLARRYGRGPFGERQWPCRTALAHHDLHRRAQADRHRGAAGAGGSMAGSPFGPTSSNAWCRRSRPAMSSCSTISPRIRSTHPPGGRYGRCHAPLPVAVFADLNPIEHDLMGWTAPPFGDGSLHRAPPWHSDAGSGGRPSHQVKQVFAKLKGPLRKVAARTKEELWSTCSTPAPPPKAPTICATATMDSVLRARFAKISVRILARLPGRAYSGNSI